MKKEEQISKLTDRQLMEQMLLHNYKAEKHLQFISNVVTIFVVITIFGAAIAIFR